MSAMLADVSRDAVFSHTANREGLWLQRFEILLQPEGFARSVGEVGYPSSRQTMNAASCISVLSVRYYCLMVSNLFIEIGSLTLKV